MEQAAAAETTLIPRGLPNNGFWIRHAKIRQLTGYDEQFLFDLNNNNIKDKVPNFIRTIALLERIVTFDNGYFNGKMMTNGNTPDTSTILQNIAIGDRNSLLLFLRKLIIGDKIQCFVACPACNGGMSFEISTDSLLKAEVPAPQIEYTVYVGSFILKIRPITGADEEAILQQQNSSSSQSQRIEQLLRSCIISSEPALMADMPLPDDFIAQVSLKLSEIDPLADIVLDLICPSCQNIFKSPFYVDDFVFQEFSSRYTQSELEAHCIAFNYHWTEEAILSLPIRKRKRYVDLINRTLSWEGEEAVA